MNLKQLESFVTVVDCKNFTKAAKKLFITQPAVSFQIKALEEQLGIQLLDRLDQEVVPTDGGLILYQEAKKMLFSYNALKNEIDKLKNFQAGTLKLGASTIPGEYILPYYLGEFAKIYPDVGLCLKIASSQHIINWLKERIIDIGVIGADISLPGIKQIPFLQDELVLVAAAASTHIGKKSILLHELRDYKLIFREKGSGTRIVVERILAQKGLELSNLPIVMELGTTRAVLTAVSADLGLSFVSRWAAKDLLAGSKLQQIKVEGIDLKRQLYLIVNEQHYLSALGGKFMEFVQNTSLPYFSN